MISIKDLSKVFKSEDREITAVDQMSLNIKEGEIFGVIGYSGAGKSTFVRLLNRLEEPTSGEIEINGKNMTKLDKNDLRNARREMGMIFQHFNLLWSRTVAENIAFPLEIAQIPKNERETRVQELIDLVGLTGKESSYPSQLSGGQKQRVGIARALANKPKVLLCDEATSALDPETTNSILDLLVDINKKLGLTIILITHEMHVIQKICNRVAVMENGKVVEIGDVIDVFSRPRQTITKKFVEQVMSSSDETEDIDFLIQSHTKGKLIRLHFIGETTNETLISKIGKNYKIDINILQGKIMQTKRGPYGTLVVQIEGDDLETSQALQYINEKTSVEVEVLEDAN
ncbi:MAG TPA: ATP-binding cassette domain-containing protein [Candidatus Avamphibacillus sp.]|nr:ATP-binding cassette domain-containing protein [Candidatus Avamphibacillus sp.]